MIIIESKHIWDEIRKSCPIQLGFSLERITLLPPASSSKSFGVCRFEGAKEKEVSCAWWINVQPEATELVIKWIGKEAPMSVEL